MADQQPSTRVSTPPSSAPRRSADGPAPTAEGGSIGDVIETVKQYARQETLGPLKGAARWMAFGSAAALSIGVGASLIILALLRMIENEFAPTFAGPWMRTVPYLVALIACVVVIGLAVSRIGKKSLASGHQKQRK